jgi:3-oxoacyl-[acyl-carrier-protein] synthase-1
VALEPVFIAALGASTAVGRDAWSSAAAVRAAIAGFADHPFMVDSAGEPMRVAVAPWLDIDCAGVDRFEALLVPALEQALEPVHVSRDGAVRVALALGLPEPRPGVPADLDTQLRAIIANRFPSRFAAVATFPVGHAAGLLGLHAARVKLSEGAFEACLVAGVESYLSPETLEWLERHEQLHGAGALNNAWGFIPGEAAGAVLVVTSAVAERLQIEPLAGVLSVGRGLEPNRIKTSTVCIGEGLTTAFRGGLLGLPRGERVTDVVCDMNGEPYRADEFGFAAVRTSESFVSVSNVLAPADCWGDVGAAGGPLHLMLASVAAVKSYADGRYPFVWASSESGERVAVALEC